MDAAPISYMCGILVGLSDFIAKYWREILALIGAVIGLWKYLDTRKRELDWRKTEFMFQEAKYLDNDPDIIKAVQVLAKEQPNISVDDIFGEKYDHNIRSNYIIGFEKLFNLLDRLSHTHYSLKTLSKKEIENFGWYLREIQKYPQLLDYCENNGYKDVVKLSKNI